LVKSKIPDFLAIVETNSLNLSQRPRVMAVGSISSNKSELLISEGWWVYVNDFVDFDGKFGGGGGVVSNFSYLCRAKQPRDEVTTQTTTIYIITCEH